MLTSCEAMPSINGLARAEGGQVSQSLSFPTSRGGRAVAKAGGACEAPMTSRLARDFYFFFFFSLTSWPAGGLTDSSSSTSSPSSCCTQHSLLR
jgi:hypothetical protein